MLNSLIFCHFKDNIQEAANCFEKSVEYKENYYKGPATLKEKKEIGIGGEGKWVRNEEGQWVTKERNVHQSVATDLNKLGELLKEQVRYVPLFEGNDLRP